MKNNDKLIERILVLVIIIIFILLGLVIYDKYNVKSNEENEIIINNYYNQEFLFNNGYITLANTIDKLNNNEIKIYQKDTNLIIEKNNKTITIENLPKQDMKIYYNDLKNNCYEFSSLDNNDLYYVNLCLDKKATKNFEKISTTVKEVYILNTLKNNTYVIKDENITSNFIIETTLEEIKYINYLNNIIGVYNDLEKTRPYLDYVCASDKLKICNNIISYLTFENKLVMKNNLEKPIKINKKEDLIVQDLFATFETKEKINNLENLEYNEFINKYEFIFTIYILDKDNNLYEIEFNNDSINDKEEIIARLISKEKVHSIEYKNNDNKDIESIQISFINGDPLQIIKDENTDIITSTKYERVK